MTRPQWIVITLTTLLSLGACSGLLDTEGFVGDPALQRGEQADEGSSLSPPVAGNEKVPQKHCSEGSELGWGYCSEDCPCTEGQGDCDADIHCEAGLICSHNVGERYGVEATIDVCERPEADPGQGGDPSPPQPAATEVGEGGSCASASCEGGLECIAVYSSASGSLVGSYCMERCQNLGADSACDGSESCVLAASGQHVCFDPQQAANGYTSPDDGGDVTPSPVTPPPTGGSGLCGMTDEEQGVFELLNIERAANGLGAVDCDEAGIEAARGHSQDMCDRGYFSHTSPEGEAPWDRLRNAGAQFMGAGENIAMGQQTPQAVHNAWMNSAGHRANMLNGSWTRVGIGFIRCGGGAPYWTEVFMQ